MSIRARGLRLSVVWITVGVAIAVVTLVGLGRREVLRREDESRRIEAAHRARAAMNITEEERVAVDRLHVWYLPVDKHTYSPANADDTNGVLYVWREVELAPEELHDVGWMSGGTPRLDPDKLDWWKVRDLRPPIRYRRVGETVEFGFYNWTASAFYRFSGLRYEGDRLPKEWEERELDDDPRTVQMVLDIPVPDRVWGAVFSAAGEDGTLAHGSEEVLERGGVGTMKTTYRSRP